MENSIVGFAKLMASLFVIVTICLAIGGITYQFFASDGMLYLWVKHLWETDPLKLALIGALCFLIKRWLDGLARGAKLADAMIYVAVLIGVLVGISLLAG